LIAKLLTVTVVAAGATPDIVNRRPVLVLPTPTVAMYAKPAVEPRCRAGWTEAKLVLGVLVEK
jgi:hypothetical protein